ncbi:hypothetical protein [Neptuniibacter sp.]|uniref:hypothetical protein n=1 Tax=Neptuniibacter sp. TaxID=1962643 RepID=UPI003B597DD6
MKDSTFIIETDYTVNYTTKQPVPIPEIIESLKSFEKLIHRTPVFIEKSYKGIKVVDVEVYVDNLKSGSLIEKFIIKYIVKGEDNYEKAKEVVDKIIEDNTMIRTVVAMGIGAIVTYGVMSTIPASSPSKHIEAYNNNIVNIGGTVDLKAEDISAILDGMKDKKGLAKDSITALKPARSDHQATIEFSGISALTIDQNFVDEAPEEYTPPIPDEREDKYSNVDVTIYASDRDKTDSTWAGIVPGVVDKRTNFHLDEGIDPAKLHGRLRVKADISVISRFIKSKKKYEAKLVEIHSTN